MRQKNLAGVTAVLEQYGDMGLVRQGIPDLLEKRTILINHEKYPYALPSFEVPPHFILMFE